MNYKQMEAFYKHADEHPAPFDKILLLRIHKTADDAYSLGWKNGGMLFTLHENEDVSFYKGRVNRSELEYIKTVLPKGCTRRSTAIFLPNQTAVNIFDGIRISKTGELRNTQSEVHGIGTTARNEVNQMIIKWRRKAMILIKMLGIDEAAMPNLRIQKYKEFNPSYKSNYISNWILKRYIKVDSENLYDWLNEDVTKDRIESLLFTPNCFSDNPRKLLDAALNKHRNHLVQIHNERRNLNEHGQA